MKEHYCCIWPLHLYFPLQYGHIAFLALIIGIRHKPYLTGESRPTASVSRSALLFHFKVFHLKTFPSLFSAVAAFQVFYLISFPLCQYQYSITRVFQYWTAILFYQPNKLLFNGFVYICFQIFPSKIQFFCSLVFPIFLNLVLPGKGCRQSCATSVLPWLLLFTSVAKSWWQNGAYSVLKICPAAYKPAQIQKLWVPLYTQCIISKLDLKYFKNNHIKALKQILQH